MTPRQLIVIRHAQTFDNGHLTADSGRTPWDLSPAGREQCRHLALELARRIDATNGVALYSSTAQRAIETADAIREAFHGLDVPHIATPDLLELGYGDLGVPVKDGREWCRVVADKKRQWEEGGGHPDDFKLAGGMSHREMMAHTRAVMTQLLGGNRANMMILVAHAFFNVMLLRDLLNLPDAIPQHNACINALSLNSDMLEVIPPWVINDVSHLPDHLRDGGAPPTLDVR
jgi:broad specificity phosphatase PhoE